MSRAQVPSSAGTRAPDVGFNWFVERSYLDWAVSTLAPSGVLLTAGKWYFEVHFDDERWGELAIGVCDTAFGTNHAIARFDNLGVDKHSWGLSVGPFWGDMVGCLRHSDSDQRFGAEPAFKRRAHNLRGLIIGCAIDADVGTIHYTMNHEDEGETPSHRPGPSGPA